MKLASPPLFRTLSEVQAKSETLKDAILKNVTSATAKGSLTKEQKAQAIEAVKSAADGVASVPLEAAPMRVLGPSVRPAS
jgi:hypothetical protein